MMRSIGRAVRAVRCLPHPYDAVRKRRHPKGLLVYIKFSIEADGALTIALVSCHAA